ncbi:hypothetical protein I317_03336 [Kwoniella heveanensis CBS 569]|nr:hypothetical protein I317_03336 [Kwoniella heveanensis CBS 569]
MDIDKDAARPPPVRRKTRRSIWRCLGVSCGLIVLGIIIFVGYIGYTVAKSPIDTARNPHKHLLYNGTSPPGSDDKALGLTASQVVRPFIEPQTKFDVLLTVYVRLPNDETDHKEEYATEKDWKPDGYTGSELANAANSGRSPVEVRWKPTEQVVFQQIVMRDMSMSHRDVDVTVNFDLPLKRFYDYYLYAEDVRMAVALIPTVNSKLDRLADFTDWRPTDADVSYQKISPEFIDSHPLNTDGSDDSKQWAALEAMGFTLPIIEFHNHPDNCNKTDSPSAQKDALDDDDDLYSSIMDDDQDDKNDNIVGNNKPEADADADAGASVEGEVVVALKDQHEQGDGGIDAAERKKLVEKIGNGKVINEDLRPYIVTRSHVYIINETRLFDRKAYDNAHKNLRKHACGKSAPGNLTHRFRCYRTYDHNGHWSTRLVLNPSPSTSDNVGTAAPKGKELAYGPYLGSLRHGAGPKDVKLLPVTRRQCSPSSNVTDPETLNVNYTIRFSSLTPARVHLLDNFVQPHRSAHNATDTDRAELQDEWEQASGVWGSRGKGTHPWRRLIITMIRDVFLSIPIWILGLLYWYTRLTVRGIYLPSVYTLVATGLVKAAVMQISLWHTSTEVGTGILTVLFTLLELAPLFLQLRLVLPFEVERKGWKLSFRRWRWSHSERASQRQGTGFDWKVWTGVFAALFSVCYFPRKKGYLLIHPHRPPTPDPKIHWLAKSTLVSSIGTASWDLSFILQVAHNFRTGTFAGMYALTAYLDLAHRVTKLVYYLPWVVGKYEVWEGMAWHQLVMVAVEIVLVYQAWTMPRVEQKVEDVDEE